MAVQELPSRPPPPRSEGLVGRAWELQHRLESRTKNLGKGKYGRVLKMARKPDQEEFNQVAKVTTVGMIVIGALGFTIYFILAEILRINS